jgi:hypothetical protein
MAFLSRTSAVFAGALAALSLAGCGQAAPDGTGDEGPLDESASALSANDKTAFDYFLAKGLTPVQAAGIVGNLEQESSMNPTAVQPGGPGRGIAQWSVGGRWDHDSGDNAVAYATSQGKSVLSFGLQLDFIWFELTTFSSYGLSALKKSTTTTDATLAFMKDFEACGTCLSSQRISYAQAALAAYGKDQVDAGTDASSSTKSDAGKADGSAVAKGDDGGGGATGSGSSASAEDGDGGSTVPTKETTAAEAHADAIADDQGGCSVARGEKSSHRGVADQTWLASVCAAFVIALRRRRQRKV